VSGEADVLKEVRDVRQIRGQGFRRWFSSQNLQLIVWYEADKETLAGFQLCYDEDHALTWTRSDGYLHTGVDTGDERTPSGTKMTPILVADGAFDSERISKRFRDASVRMEWQLAELIYATLKAYPGNQDG